MLWGSRSLSVMKFNPTHRLNPDLAFPERTRAIMEILNCTNQEATHVLWECGFTMGTDRAIWVNEARAIKFLVNRRNAECLARMNGQL